MDTGFGVGISKEVIEMQRIQNGLVNATLDTRLTPREYELLRTLDILDHACKYLAAQFNVDMSVRDAKANLEARNMLMIKRARIINGCRD
jgi:hypothetical protein